MNENEASWLFPLIILYIILCIQVHLNKKKKSQLSFFEEGSSNTNESQAPEKVGLGIHFMFSLILSNLLASIIPIVFYTETNKLNIKNETIVEEEEKEKIIYFLNHTCIIFGFFHYYLDLVSVCWITILMNLIYRSTYTVEFKKGEEKKTYLIGFGYSMFTPLVLTIIPLIMSFWSENSYKIYGYADSYCSLNYTFRQKVVNVFLGLFIAFMMSNLIMNLYQLIRVIIHYQKRLKILKEQNNKEYKVITIYLIIFICFPIHLVITRIFKSLNRFFSQAIMSAGGNKRPLQEINTFFSCFNGAFLSIFCCYFFRGVFSCKCCNNDSKLAEPSVEIPIKSSLLKELDDDDE